MSSVGTIGPIPVENSIRSFNMHVLVPHGFPRARISHRRESSARSGVRGFYLGVTVYCLASVVIAGVIVLRGDGPHPRVIGWYPANADRYWPGGTAQITFSQAMNQSSVERALQVSPGAQGQGVWYGNTLNLQPVGDWKPNITYHLMLRGTVVDEQGRPLQTPISFWFRVHHVKKLEMCGVRGVRNVCERMGTQVRALTHSTQTVSSYSLSPDGSLLAYTHRDHSGLSHLFVIGVDGTEARQLTSGHSYSDSNPVWIPGDSSSITYSRRPVGSIARNQVQTWNVQTDGTSNSRLS